MHTTKDNFTETTQEMTWEEQHRMQLLLKSLQAESQGTLLGAMRSEVGARKNQQDSCYLDVGADGNAVAVICDGMGGLVGGEIASGEAVRAFAEAFESVRYTRQDFQEFFAEEMAALDYLVEDLTDETGSPLSAGTTLVAVAVKNDCLQWVSVGDSKIYLLRSGRMVCLPEEHNYQNLLNKQLLAGQIDEATYAREIRRGAALTSYLGMGGLRLVDQNKLPLLDGDRILLCSDGLYKAISEEQIAKTVLEYENDLEGALDSLQQQAALAAGRAQDNTSIVLLAYRRN